MSSFASFAVQVKINYRQAVSTSNVNDFWTVQVCRRIAAVLVVPMANLTITPNQISWLSLAINIGGGYFLLIEKFQIAALLFLLSYIFDCADGQLALLKNSASKYGNYLDLILDAVKDLITFTILMVIFLDTRYQWLSIIVLSLVSLTLIFDWAHRTVTQTVKPTRPSTPQTFRGKYGIQFWTVPIRNFIIVISLLFAEPQWILYYVILIGGYLTAKKGVRILSLAKKQDILS